MSWNRRRKKERKKCKANMEDLFAPDYFAKKLNRLAAQTDSKSFEPWEEARARYVEQRIEPLLDRYRQSDQDWFSDFNRRRGVCLHSSDLIFKLQRLNPHLFVQQQVNFPDDWRLYLDCGGRIQYLSAVPKGWMTEFSYGIMDDRNLPVEERRGWRTVVLLCLMKGALTWTQVLKSFGDPKDGYNDTRWQ